VAQGGNGAAAVFIDESASEAQVTGIATILTGQAGGMSSELLPSTFTSLDGPHMKQIKMNVNGRNSNFRIYGILEAQLAPLKNPVTGDDNEVHIVFPGGGLIWDDGDTATTSAMKVDQGDSKFDYAGQSAFFAAIEWTNRWGFRYIRTRIHFRGPHSGAASSRSGVSRTKI